MWNCTFTRQCYCIFIVLVTESLHITWKESFAGERGAMGLSVLQKWMVEGRGLGVNKTGVWITEIHRNNETISLLFLSHIAQTSRWNQTHLHQTACSKTVLQTSPYQHSLHACSFPATPPYFFPFDHCLAAVAILLHS